MHLYHASVANAKLFTAEKLFFLFVTHAVEHAGVMIEGIDVERHLHEYVRQIIERGAQTGEIRGDIKPELIAYLVAIIIGATHWPGVRQAIGSPPARRGNSLFQCYLTG